ncbi:hypothetical protein [Hymenobacter sp. UYP22]|uniref:hypothetical protein n=1 Tax=Hymenobacter sp. UYP22 TaxID=3156348 RepID=UPI003396FA07
MRLFSYSACVLLITSGCTVFSPYKNTRDYWYYNSLSASEKEMIEVQKQISKDWHGTNKNGDSTLGKLIIIKDTLGLFTFIETGVWRHKYVGQAAKGWRGIVTDSIVYDDHGNILYREEYLDENQDAIGPYLFEKWTASKTDSLRQTVTSYYPNGQVRYTQQATVLNPTELVTDYRKRKVLRSTKAYDETGKSISTQELEKLLYVWYQPHVSMKLTK